MSLHISGEDRLSDHNFQRLSEYISKHVGIRMPPEKRSMAESRLRKRVRALGLSSVSEYCSLIFDKDGLKEEHADLVDVMTTNTTDFFREPDHFECLKNIIIPSLISQRSGRGKPRLKIWSAASSIGAEAYTIAMVLSEMSLNRSDFLYSILGTDISLTVLDQAKIAIYPTEMINTIPKSIRERYLLQSRSGQKPSQVRIIPELRKQVRFSQMNLTDETYSVDRDVDVIFLRNVLIYFDAERQEAIIKRLFGHLRKGGYLLIGHSESLIRSAVALRQIAPAVFQKI